MARVKSNKINVYKIKDSSLFATLDFKDGGFNSVFESPDRKLFIRSKSVSTPAWVEYLKPLLGTNVSGLISMSASFILLIKHNANVYALSGGYGHTQLEQYIEDDFGIRLALRMIDEKEIAALNQRSLKGTTRQIFRAVAGYAPVFDKDNFTRMLKAIEGKAVFEGRTFRIVGKSAVSLRTTKDISKLDEVITELETIIGLEEKIHFPRSFEIVKDKALILKLEEAMFRSVQAYWNGSMNREMLYLELKDPFVQFRCDKFIGQYGRNKIDFESFDLDIICAKFKDVGVVGVNTIDDLNKIFLTGFNEDGHEEFDQTFVELLVCETTHAGKSYIRIGGHWLVILDEIQNFIDNELRSVVIERDLLPDWDKKLYPVESAYNNFLAGQNHFVFMDAKCVYIKGRSKIELCDVFDKNRKRFFHIKETWGCKSAYLFTQGSTSAEFFYNSADFRMECQKKWPTQFDGEHKDFNVVFGIAAERAADGEFPLNMTFFAKLNLYNAIALLKQIGYGVLLAPIKIV